jgi:putative hydrolase of the HAD superfamily
MRGYSDLPVIAALRVERVLVTSGFRRLQESKIRALNVAKHFMDIHVDAIDEPERLGKQRIFELIMNERSLGPADVLVVGDNPDSEIAAGTRLGIRTVQTLRPGVVRSIHATHHIASLTELPALLGSPQANQA